MSTTSTGASPQPKAFSQAAFPSAGALAPSPATSSSRDSPDGIPLYYKLSQYVFVVNAIAFAAGLLLFIQNAYILLIIRIIQGLCVGFYSSITPVIIKEISPNEISGTLGALNQFFIAFGVFFSFFFKFILEKIAND